MLIGACLVLSASPLHGQSTAPASQPASDEIRPFQPGVDIDWKTRTVYVDGQVVLREGPVEFLACFAGKEHESIVRLGASATHIYMALGLVGLEPGHPPRWDEQRGGFGPPAGDLIDVSIEWQDAGERRTAGGFEWLRAIEFARAPIDRPWVFAGSRRLADGTLSADRSGAGIAVVDMPDSLLALSRSHVSSNAELWAEANTAAIPPTQTPVRVVLRPARARAYNLRVDFRGATFVNDQFAHPEDLADLVKLARRLLPERVQVIQLERTLRSDVERLRDRLERAGVPAGAFRFVASERSAETGRDGER